MNEIRRLVLRMYWHAMSVEKIAAVLEIDVAAIFSMLFTNIPDRASASVIALPVAS